MVAIDLDASHQEQLNTLAGSKGQDAAALARQVLLDFLDFQQLPADSDAAWAEAAVKLTAETMSVEDWDETGDGSR